MVILNLKNSDKLDIRTSRRYRLSNGPLWTGSMGYWYTYHTITHTVSGTCTGFSGDGSGIPIEIYRVVSSTQDELVLKTTTTIGGVFSTQFVNDSDILFAVARQDDQHVGRSSNGVAG